MFRRLSHTLPKDATPPAILEELGYFVNANDQIRMIKNPEQKYQYAINRNGRFNDVYKEAMNACVRTNVAERVAALGVQTIRLPIGAGESENHVPILVSQGILSKKRVIVLFGERNQDLGIFSQRVIAEENIKVGSILELVNTVLNSPTPRSSDNAPGIVISNPSQLWWYKGGSRAVSWQEWQNLPREYAVYDAFRVDEVKNTVPGNRDFREHINYVFENVLKGLLHEDVRLDLIGLEYSGAAALEYLVQHWSIWSKHISSICFGGPQHSIEDLAKRFHAPDSFIEFISKRSRAYFLSEHPIETVIKGRETFGCNCFASGEQMYEENVITRSWRSMLDWFNLVHAVLEYEEVEMVPEEDDIEPQTEVNGHETQPEDGDGQQ